MAGLKQPRRHGMVLLYITRASKRQYGTPAYQGKSLACSADRRRNPALIDTNGFEVRKTRNQASIRRREATDQAAWVIQFRSWAIRTFARRANLFI